MKKLLVIALIPLFIFVGCGKKEEKKKVSFIKKGTKFVTSLFVSTSKNALSGVKEGIAEGRKSGESLDGAIVVNNKEDLLKYTELEVISVEKGAGNNCLVVLAIKNNTDEVLRFASLSQLQSVVLVDTEGFASPLSSVVDSQTGKNTVLANTSLRIKFSFSKVEGIPAIFRIYGYDINIENLLKDNGIAVSTDSAKKTV